jgi:phage terminase large subunit-like protein
MGYLDTANQYIDKVLSGSILACKYVKQCYQRHRNDLEKSKDPNYLYQFDSVKAERVCQFLELLPHVKGKWAGKKFILEPWQAAYTMVLFGWVHRDTGFRRFRFAYIELPRKDGKSLWAAGVSLYFLLADGEVGAEVYIGSTNLQQSFEVFRPAKQMVEKFTALQRRFGIEVMTQSLIVPSTGSRMLPIISVGKEGSAPSLFVADEMHQWTSDELYDAQQTGMGSRQQPLALVITTAGDNIASPCKMMHDDVDKMLAGVFERDNLFGLIYGLDDDDDWTTEKAIYKANPNVGVSVDLDYLKSQQQIALQSSGKRNRILTRHFNVWCNASSSWMSLPKWSACGDAALIPDAFKDCVCWIGLDLAAKIDMAAAVKLFRKEIDGQAHYYIFPRFYLPSDRTNDPSCQHYQKWVHDGHLIATPGNVIDYATIQDDLKDDAKKYKVLELDFDEWGAEYLRQQFHAETKIATVQVPQAVKHLSDPAKEFEALVMSGRLHHDANPVMTWCVSNVVAKYDKHDNLVLDKDKPENKIDGVDATLNALARALAAPLKAKWFKPFQL